MQQYPYDNPFVLTDEVFLKYGGQTGTSTPDQRSAAYLMAEEQMTEHLSSFLKPTVITGTLFWRNSFYETEFGYIQRVLSVSVTEIKKYDPLETRTVTGSVLIRNAQYGYLDVVVPGVLGHPYSSSVVYESGLSTGTVASPTFLQALTVAAQINLNEMDVSLSNESTGDIGVQSYSNQSYTENRVKLGKSAFGNSALAQRAARMVKKYRSKPAIGFH